MVNFVQEKADPSVGGNFVVIFRERGGSKFLKLSKVILRVFNYGDLGFPRKRGGDPSFGAGEFNFG